MGGDYVLYWVWVRISFSDRVLGSEYDLGGEGAGKGVQLHAMTHYRQFSAIFHNFLLLLGF